MLCLLPVFSLVIFELRLPNRKTKSWTSEIGSYKYRPLWNWQLFCIKWLRSLYATIRTDQKVVKNIRYRLMHCKDKMPKIWNKYSQKRNIGASVPISTFMCLWAHYENSRDGSAFSAGGNMWTDPWNICINRSQTHECGNWGWGRAIPRKGICGIAVQCLLFLWYFHAII
jgi:hypothetical protein